MNQGWLVESVCIARKVHWKNRLHFNKTRNCPWLSLQNVSPCCEIWGLRVRENSRLDLSVMRRSMAHMKAARSLLSSFWHVLPVIAFFFLKTRCKDVACPGRERNASLICYNVYIIISTQTYKGEKTVSSLPHVLMWKSQLGVEVGVGVVPSEKPNRLF